jgi:hypothetical protein
LLRNDVAKQHFLGSAKKVAWLLQAAFFRMARQFLPLGTFLQNRKYWQVFGFEHVQSKR